VNAASRIGDRSRFIRANTSLSSPPHVPEIRLLLAGEAHELWKRTEEELQEIGLPPPFWAFAWAGGQGLARHLLDNPAIVAGKKVVDFASGSGLVAIAAALCGARQVTAFDIDPFAQAATTLNAGLNGVSVDLGEADLLGDPASLPHCDLLLAGDVFYDREMADRVLPLLRATALQGVTVLVGDPGRAYFPRDGVRLLSTHEVAGVGALEDAEVKRTHVWGIRPA
jgi:predicted nicotinamide N-methyase